MQPPPSFGCFPPMRMGPKYSCAGPFVSPPGSRPQGLAGKKKHSRSALVSHPASHFFLFVEYSSGPSDSPDQDPPSSDVPPFAGQHSDGLLQFAKST